MRERIPYKLARLTTTILDVTIRFAYFIQGWGDDAPEEGVNLCLVSLTIFAGETHNENNKHGCHLKNVG